MYAQGVFYKSPDQATNPNPEYNELWNLTWKILSCVLPKLKDELFSNSGTFTPVIHSPSSSNEVLNEEAGNTSLNNEIATNNITEEQSTDETTVKIEENNES